MNVYDFDGTIYAGDSTIHFYRFMLKQHPEILRYFPQFCLTTLQHKTGQCSTKAWKESFFSFLKAIPDVQTDVKRFWELHFQNIMPWYLQQKQGTDVIISASPEFLLDIPVRKLGAGKLIASEVDMRSGVFHSENCKGEEKVRRFRREYPDGSVDRFYSDSASDLPMAQLAGEAFLCKKGCLKPWDIRKGA